MGARRAGGIYRQWCDGGYAGGALTVSLIAEALGKPIVIVVIGGLTFLSGLVIMTAM